MEDNHLNKIVYGVGLALARTTEKYLWNSARTPI
jgi:hypothetical protein